MSEMHGQGQEPAIVDNQPPAGSGVDWEAEARRVRQEAASYRVQLRETQQQLEQAQPLLERLKQMEDADRSEAEKLAQRIADMQTQLDAANALSERANAERSLVVLATKAGVPADMLQYLDVSKFNLEDESGTLDALSKLVPKPQANSGGASNPARQEGSGELTPAEWWQAGRGHKNYIFGDK